MAIQAEPVPGKANTFALNFEGRVAIAEARQAEHGGRRTSFKPIDVGGVIWLCWSTGILRTEFRAILYGKLLIVRSNHNSSGYYAMVGGAVIPSKSNARKPHRFTTRQAAMLATIKAAS